MPCLPIRKGKRIACPNLMSEQLSCLKPDKPKRKPDRRPKPPIKPTESIGERPNLLAVGRGPEVV